MNTLKIMEENKHEVNKESDDYVDYGDPELMRDGSNLLQPDS